MLITSTTNMTVYNENIGFLTGFKSFGYLINSLKSGSCKNLVNLLSRNPMQCKHNAVSIQKTA